MLIADDNEPLRTVYATLLGEIRGVGSVVTAADGVAAVELGEGVEFDAAVLDLRMPRLDGVEAALRLAALQPTMAIAVHSSDPEALRRRADGLDVALFDKAELGRLVAWVEGEVARRRRSRSAPPPRIRRDHSCARCGYGVASEPPRRCPMCNSETDWVAIPARGAVAPPAA